MRSLTHRIAAIAAVVPLALGTLAACGNGNDDSATAADPQASTTSSPGSSSGSSGPTTTGDGATHQHETVDPAAFVVKLKNAARSITTARFTMDMELGGQSVSAKGAVDMTGDKPAMQLSMDLTGMGTPTDMRLVDGTMYIQAPGSDGKYLKMDLSDPNGPLAGYGDALLNYDPRSMIDQITADAFKKVTDLGPEAVGGQQREHYRVTLDTAAATKIFGNLPSTASMPKTLTYDLWLDGEGRMSRFTMLLKNVTRVTATYSDYGADVHITAPDPSKVMTVPGTTS
jgi:hypothetical protein